MSDPQARQAVFVANAHLPAGHYDLFAICRIPFDDIMTRTEVLASRSMHQGRTPFRAVAVALPSGRHAQLRAYDRIPDQLEVYMETVDDWNSCRADLKEICLLMDVRLQNLVWRASKAQLRLMRADDSNGMRIKVSADH